MTTANVTYEGNLRTTAIHLQSNNQIITDAPVDNHGRGEAFSPTDLLATSLACCMMTVMGIKAESMGLDLAGSTADVTKVMITDPRRVGEIDVVMTVKGVSDDKDKTILTNTAMTCPVAKSLHPDIVQNVKIEFV
ncbi:OsmC family protein [Faucicola mancuniensis]|uniref:OsmC family protein n=1 Tax=Faucicola mancuniensis TaxID=1309795 RepID=UPI0028EC6E28|nr:OsmC family protein [uncultured Moraxella sp.]